MEEEQGFTPNPQALALAQYAAFHITVDALFATHPEPAAFAAAMKSSLQEWNDALLPQPAPEVTFDILEELIHRMIPPAYR